MEKGYVVEPPVDDDPRHAESEGGIGISFDRQPFVGLGSGAAKVGINDHDPSPALCLHEMVGVGETGLNDVGTKDECGSGVDPLE